MIVCLVNVWYIQHRPINISTSTYILGPICSVYIYMFVQSIHFIYYTDIHIYAPTSGFSHFLRSTRLAKAVAIGSKHEHSNILPRRSGVRWAWKALVLFPVLFAKMYCQQTVLFELQSSKKNTSCVEVLTTCTVIHMYFTVYIWILICGYGDFTC